MRPHPHSQGDAKDAASDKDNASGRLTWKVETAMPTAGNDPHAAAGKARRRRTTPVVLTILAVMLVVALAFALTIAKGTFGRMAATGRATDAAAVADTTADADTDATDSRDTTGTATVGTDGDSSSSGASHADGAAEGAGSDGTDADAAGKSSADSADGQKVADQPSSPEELRSRLGELFSGASYALEVADAKTGRVRFAIDEDAQFASASTYKLFIAQDMAAKVEDGTMTWDSPLNDMPLADCLTTMIVDSDNDCPIAWMENVSPSATMTANARKLGATGTDFRLDGIVQTTASDLTLVLRGLGNHTIVSQDSATRIIDLMKRQVYREGIPAGLGEGTSAGKGITVADKVGFLDGYLNDAAIVHSPKGDFTFVILTEGASWELIAQAAALAYGAL